MLSLSVHKKLDYSTPIMFIPAYVSPSHKATEEHGKTTADRPLGTQTTTKPIIKKTTPVATKPVTQNKIVTPPKKPTVTTTIAAKTGNPKKAVLPDVKKVESKIEPASFEPSFAKASEARQRTSGKDKIESKKETPPIKPTIAQKKETSFDKLRTSGESVAKTVDTQKEIAAAIPDNAHVSNNYREVEALRMQAQLQKEIVQKWKPPIGVSPDCTCDVSFFVNTTGGVENIKMAKSSGVMMFDISTRQALCAIKMPHWTHGKTLTITFKQ